MCRNYGCYVYFGGTSTNWQNNNGIPTGTSENPSGNAYAVRIKVCDPSVGLEDNCVKYDGTNNYKPVGVLQKYSSSMRFGIITYALGPHNNDATNGGVIRANMKWISWKIPPGFRYRDEMGHIQTCSDPNGCNNPRAEIRPDGTLIPNPDSAPGGKSGVINYLNKFGYKQGYKSLDPISEMYYEAIRYFKNEGPTKEYCQFDNGSKIPQTDDGFPVYCGDVNGGSLRWQDPMLYWCQKNFIVGLNDANPWLDKRLPGTFFTKSNCSVYFADSCDRSGHPDHNPPSNPDPDINVEELTKQVGDIEGITGKKWCIGCVPGNCKLKYCPLPGTGDCKKLINNLGRVFGTCPWTPKKNSYYIAGLAYYAHINDLRPDLPGKQNITTYMIDSQESNSSMLVGRINMLYLAAKYGGFNDINKNDKPDQTEEWDADGDGFPDTYFFASDPSKIEEHLTKAFEDILAKSAAGSAVSVIAATSKAEGLTHQAYFSPAKFAESQKITWIGEVRGFFVDANGNLREDTDNDHALTTENDYVVKFEFDASQGQTVVRKYKDENGVLNFVGEYDLDSVAAAWDGGKWLWNVNPRGRKIFVFVDKNKNGRADYWKHEVMDFKRKNKKYFRKYMGVNKKKADTLIDFIRGKDFDGYRVRKIKGKVWKLGDIIYSTPVHVGPPSANYHVLYNDQSYRVFLNNFRDRPNIVLVGGNDGMLHAFYIGRVIRGDDPLTLDKKEIIRLKSYGGHEIGEELWAFIPFNLLPHLQWLMMPDYGHLPYVDLKPKLADMRIFDTTDVDRRGWGTVAIVGMGFGGAPTKVAKRTLRSAYFAIDITEPTDPVYLWEFTHTYLGYTKCYPSVAKVENKWFVIVGSGPTKYDPEAYSSQKGRVFVLNAKTGQVQRIFKISENNSFISGLTAVDVNMDFTVDVIYATVNYKSAGVWKGRIYRIVTYGNPDPDEWDILPLTSAIDRPVSAPVSVAFDSYGDLWVYFGTGRYYTRKDAGDMRTNNFYGIIDKDWASGLYMVDVHSLIDVTSAKMDTSDTVAEGYVVHTSSGTYRLTEFINQVINAGGWAFTLPLAGERVTTKPYVVTGGVVFTSFKPSDDACSYGGTGYVYTVFYLTGTNIPPQETRQQEVGEGTPSEPIVHMGEEKKMFIQTSTGRIAEVSANLPFKLKSGVILWRRR